MLQRGDEQPVLFPGMGERSGLPVKTPISQESVTVHLEMIVRPDVMPALNQDETQRGDNRPAEVQRIEPMHQDSATAPGGPDKAE